MKERRGERERIKERKERERERNKPMPYSPQKAQGHYKGHQAVLS